MYKTLWHIYATWGRQLTIGHAPGQLTTGQVAGIIEGKEDHNGKLY